MKSKLARCQHSVDYQKIYQSLNEELTHVYSSDCQCIDCLRERCRLYEIIINQQSEQIKLLTLQKESESYKDILADDQLEELSRIRKLYIKESIVGISKQWDINKDTLNGLYFYTITFSPKRFYQHTDKQYKDYIIYHMIRLRQINLAFDYYGCFEKHRNGVIHSHIIIKGYQHDEIKKYLNQWFNHDARNRHCIDQKAIDNIDRVMDYINKVQEGAKDRSDHFFKLKEDRIVRRDFSIKNIK